MVYLTAGCQSLLGTVFLAAALGKLLGRHAFTEFVAVIETLGTAIRPRARAIAVMTVTFEAVVPALLLTAALPADPMQEASAWLRTGALLLSLALLTAFTVGITRALRAGTRANCACFGTKGTVLGKRHVIRNLILAVIACAGFAGHLVAGETGGASVGIALAVAGGAVLASIFILFDDIAWLFVPNRATV
jgi:hypothetical protein